MKVELIWQRDCPNVAAARRHLLEAFSASGIPARWSEWCLDEECPAYTRSLGSPSILVNGVDVSGGHPSGGRSCRLYLTRKDELVGAPPLDVIFSAMERAARGELRQNENKPPRGQLISALPAIGIAMLPKIACPACWPAYIGVLGSLGVSFLIETRHLFLLTVAFLIFALFFMAFRARQRRGYYPLALGLFASTLLLVGKFHFDNNLATFGGTGLLMIASLWNSWPRTTMEQRSRCEAC